MNTSDYLQRVETHLSALLRESAFSSAEDVLCRMRGAPPELVLQLRTELLRVYPPASNAEIEAVLTHSGHEPHPLDYAWTFTRASAQELASRARVDDQVLLVGTPTLADLLGAQPSTRRVVLVDRSPLVAAHVARVELVQRDLCEEIDTLDYECSCVFLDPPWYPEFARRWLTFALAHCARGARLHLVLWPELVRPTAAAERATLLSDIARLGPVRVEPNAVRYSVPTFERRVLSEHGLQDLGPWRVGDLVTLEVDNPAAWTPDTTRFQMRCSWFRYAIGERQIALRRRDEPWVAPRVRALPSGRYYLGYSRRDPDRLAIDMWCSNGFACCVDGLSHFQAALDAIAGGEHTDARDAQAAEKILLESALAGGGSRGVSVHRWIDKEWRSEG